MLHRRRFLAGLLSLPFLDSLRVSERPRITGAPSFTIAFGSCALQEEPQPVWDAIADAAPDVFIFCGDNVYADTEDMSLMRAAYDRLAAIPEFARFRERHRILATWDDHDYGADDTGAEYPKKAESKEIFLEFFGDDLWSDRRFRDGVYTSYFLNAGPRRIQVILLDLRWFRTPEALLGDAQWEWLEDQLRRPADARVLVSSSQLISGEHQWDRWAAYPHEKARLFTCLDQLRIKNLLVLSGDMHFGEISRESTPLGTWIYDFTSSGLNRFDKADDIVNSRRLDFCDTSANFGLVHFDWVSGSLGILCELRDPEGRTIFTRRVL